MVGLRVVALGVGACLALSVLPSRAQDANQDNLDANTPVANNVAPNPFTTPYSPPSPNNPLLQAQGPTSSAAITDSQAAQLLAPNLYTTGTNDLSQVATNAALSQAFNEALAPVGSEAADASAGPIGRVILGPILLKAALATNVVSDSNIRATPPGPTRQTDTIYTVTPAIFLAYGAEEGQRGTVTLTYAPSFSRYLHYSAEDSDNQNVTLSAEYPFQRLTLMFNQTYSQSTGVNTDLNDRTTQTNTVTTFGGSYQVDEKITAEAHFNYIKSAYSSGGGQGGNGDQGGGVGLGDESKNIDTALDYQLSDKITVGPGFNIGTDSPEGSPNQTFEQALVRITYNATERINLFGQGGLEFVQYSHNGGDQTNPIFSIGASYSPFDSTLLALNASRTVRNSTADSSDTVLSTGVGFNATQRLFHRFYLGLSFTYEDDQYSNTGTGPSVPQGTIQDQRALTSGSQEVTTFQPSLMFDPTPWTSVALYYQYSDNQSANKAESYHDNQAGVSLSAQF